MENAEFKCPKCKSPARRDGHRRSGYHQLQMFKCTRCFYAFSEVVLNKAFPSDKKEPEISLDNLVCEKCGGGLVHRGHHTKYTGEKIPRYRCKKCGKDTYKPIDKS